MKDGPFVGLRPFESTDRSIFFGREREKEVLVNLVLSSAGVVVFAPSGAGKSSLLRAGVAPALRDEKEIVGPVLVISDWGADLVRQIRDGIAEADPKAASGGEDQSLFALLEDHRSRTGQRSVIILDQFEELFREPRDLTPAWDELAPIINTQRGPACIVLSIREDYIANLNDLMNRAPGLMTSRFRLESPTAEALREAVDGPLATLKPKFTAEPALVEAVIGDLQRSEMGRTDTPIEPAYFQIVWSRLWEAARGSSTRTITLAAYSAEGGVQDIVAGFIDKTIDQVLTPDQKQLLYGVVRYMVLPTGAKMAIGVDDLAGLVGEEDLTDLAWSDSDLLGRLGISGRSTSETKRVAIEQLLARLTRSDAPLFRRLERGPRVEYQLLHDVLGQILLQWRERTGLAAGLELRERLDRAQEALREAASPEQIQFRTDLWTRMQHLSNLVRSPVAAQRAAAADGMLVVAKLASSVFPEIRSAAEETLSQLEHDPIPTVQKAARRSIESLTAYDTLPTVPEWPELSPSFGLRAGLRLPYSGAPGGIRLFAHLYGLLIVCILSLTGADLLTRELFPVTRGFDVQPYRLASGIAAVVVWLSIYAYDTLDNGVRWDGGPYRRLATPLLRPLSMGIGFFEQMSLWPFNFLLPALAGNGLLEITAKFGGFGGNPIWFLVGFWLTNVLMVLSYNAAALLVF